MAAISTSYRLLGINCELRRSRSIPRYAMSICWRNSNMEKEDPNLSKGERSDKRFRVLESLGGIVLKLGKGLQENLSPKQKGDWKDLVLMSFSFAVYVYMSQKIVCAYCAWMSMPN